MPKKATKKLNIGTILDVLFMYYFPLYDVFCFSPENPLGRTSACHFICPKVVIREKRDVLFKSQLSEKVQKGRLNQVTVIWDCFLQTT